MAVLAIPLFCTGCFRCAAWKANISTKRPLSSAKRPLTLLTNPKVNKRLSKILVRFQGFPDLTFNLFREFRVIL